MRGLVFRAATAHAAAAAVGPSGTVGVNDAARTIGTAVARTSSAAGANASATILLLLMLLLFLLQLVMTLLK